MQNYASRQLSRKNFDIVVMGHIHNPILKELAGGVYANCGDWMRHHSYLEIIDGKPELKTYKTKETQV
jgi:UDP-2,3-diacylglucosamine hydrolase